MASTQANPPGPSHPAPSNNDSTEASREPVLKRRRVAKACQNCRNQKIKVCQPRESWCNGRHPICSRCEGYGHTCIWSDDKPRRSQSNDIRNGREDSKAGPSVDALTKSVELYEKLVHSIRPKLNNPDRATVDLTVSHIRRQLPEELQRAVVASTPQSDSGSSPGELRSRAESNGRSGNKQRYVGQASDVWFVHSVKEVFHDGGPRDNTMENYDGETPSCDRSVIPGLPSRELAESYLEIYFKTIHLAYPYISRPVFMERYRKFWDEGAMGDSVEDSWLSLLYTLFAIGAYYNSFPQSENAHNESYFQFFDQALSLSESFMTDCTLANVQTLLAQCFFLLATGQTDRCWNTLGLAIRVGQSIGLYIEDGLKRPETGASPEKRENMRRTWFSMYVLDRLVALQLGRPVAIHESDYSVNLPSRAAESVSGEDDPDTLGSLSHPSSTDYFLAIIKFSWVIGQVIKDLYSPSQVVEIKSDEMLERTAALDRILAEWKLGLPRHLRFDLGHTFEKSIIFRRQRNMLAVKFHHLRSLIHRPYLCLPYLQRHNPSVMSLLSRASPTIKSFESICVSEAQAFAHRLNNVSDVRSLVYDFPWWQMVSCLLCTSSILLVASAGIDENEARAEESAMLLNEDAETCLKVFDALSVNSGAARRARDMMTGLKRMRIRTRNQSTAPSPHHQQNTPSISLATAPPPGPPSRDLTNLPTPITSTTNIPSLIEPNDPNLKDASQQHPQQQQQQQQQSFDYPGLITEPIYWQGWPDDLSDAMAWSAQFLDPNQILDFGVGEGGGPGFGMGQGPQGPAAEGQN